MVTTYKIIFKNEHGSDGNYAFCTEKPIVDKDIGSDAVLVNVWIRKFVPDNNNFIITTEASYYAWCGKTDSKPAEGITISEGHSEGVDLGSSADDGDALKLVVKQGAPTFDKVKAKTASAGCYSITTGTDFRSDENVLIGLAQKDNKGLLVPAATIVADQNMTVNIQPVVKFFVGKFNYQVGTIINYQSFSAKAGKIDFTTGKGQGKFVAVVTHKDNGLWDIDYQN